ncbi:hypothetical protein K7957_12100 [Sphingomonas yunnanensis]|uniref:VgrG-related protein n=1 Tax=Sphingomonas yunnanensis TaxID=310400 RepID=UPI001CA7A6DF|nr:hypothetical protein [Sphingomonas yunnanensis]MBY9063675.1 hypothetical protein [Sphingomonas yunnanensis]
MRQGNERSPESRAFLHYIRTGQRVTESFFTEEPPPELKFNPDHDPANGRFTSGPAGARAVSRASMPGARRVAAPRRLPTGTLAGELEALQMGTVSSGRYDPGGVSYGVFQISTKAGMAKAFVASPEAARYAQAFAHLQPGSPAFAVKWREVTAHDPAGFDLSAHSDALRETVFSAAVQHHHAPTFIAEAVQNTDLKVGRGNARYEAVLNDEIYLRRASYLEQLALSAKKRGGKDARTFDNAAHVRMPAERAAAQKMLAPQKIEKR